MKKKSEIIPLSEMVKNYFTACYFLCEKNKTEVAKRLGISLRTVKNYCDAYKLPRRLTYKNVPIEEQDDETEYSPDFNCMEVVTPQQRDEWYNRDFL